MARRRRGRGIQPKTSESKKCSPESNVLKDNERELNSKKISNNDHPVCEAEVLPLNEINSTLTFQEEELDQTSSSFGGFTGPVAKSKLNSLTNILYTKPILTTGKSSLKLNDDVKALTLQEQNIELKGRKDDPLFIDKLIIKSEVPDQFEDNEINLVASLGHTMKVEAGESSGISDPSDSNAVLKSGVPASSLESTNEDITDYKSLFEAVCKHIKIPANISKKELFKTLNEKYLSDSNSISSKASVGIYHPIQQHPATVIDIVPSIINATYKGVDSDATSCNLGIAEKDVVNDKVIKTESDCKSPDKKPKIKTEDVLVERNNILINNSKLNQVKSQFKSEEKKLEIPVKEKLISAKEMLMVNEDILNSLSNNSPAIPLSATENVNSDVKSCNLSCNIGTEEIGNIPLRIVSELDIESNLTKEVKKEKDIFWPDVEMTTAIAEIKEEMPLASEESDSIVAEKLGNTITTGQCALNVKIKREFPLDCNIKESLGKISAEVRDEICIKIEENSLLTTELEEKTSSIEDKHCLVGKLIVDDNSADDTKSILGNNSADVNCPDNKSISNIDNISTQSTDIDKERISPVTEQDKECIDSSSFEEFYKAFCNPVKIIKSQSLKPVCEDIQETDSISIIMDDKNDPYSTKNECNEGLNSFVDSKRAKDTPLFDNNNLIKKLEANEKSENQKLEQCTTSTQPDDNKSNEVENLVADGGADIAENKYEDDTDCEVNYSDFFVIDEVNDKFYLEVCDLGKDIKKNNSPDKRSTVSLESYYASMSEKIDKNPENEKNSTSDSIPGLSFIIGMKGDNRKSSKAIYDCVLCTWDKNPSTMTAQEMKCHVKTRSHLMDLLMILNYPLYEQYSQKDRGWVTTSSLLESVMNVESNMPEQMIIAASKENYASKRKKVIARIKNLKDAFRNVGKGMLTTSGQESYIKVSAKPFVDSKISPGPPKYTPISMTPTIDASSLQVSQLDLPPVNSPSSFNADIVPVSMESLKLTAPVNSVNSDNINIQSTFTVPSIQTASSSMVVSTVPYAMQPGVQSENTTPAIAKSALPYENINSEIIRNATESASFIAASTAKPFAPSGSSLFTSKLRKETDISSNSFSRASSASAEILMPPPLSIPIPSKLKKDSKNKKKAPAVLSSIPTPPIVPPKAIIKTSADPFSIPTPPIVPPKAIIKTSADPFSIPIPPIVPPKAIFRASALQSSLPPPDDMLSPVLLQPMGTISPHQKSPVLTPVKFYDDYDQVAFVSDARYESFLENWRKVPNVLILFHPDLKPENLFDLIKNHSTVANDQKSMLYLIVTGIHSITKDAPATSCSVSNCKYPLDALNSLAEARYSRQPEKFAKLFADKLISAVNSIIPSLPQNSHIAVLPPLPIALIPVGVTHRKLHEKKLMFPDYMIANRKASIASSYKFWIDNISAVARKSLLNMKELNPSLFTLLDDTRKLKEMSCSEQDKPAYNFWKKIVRNVVNTALQRKTKESSGMFKEDAENWQTSIEKLSRPDMSNTANYSSGHFTKIAYDHLVFIGHSTSLELLPEIEFCHNSKWDFEEIVESQNLFIKMGSLNKMAIKKVLFIIISDIAMIGVKERNPECLVKKCEKTLMNIHAQVKRQVPSKMSESIYTPIDIIITEIKKFCIFESRVVVAPLTPMTYIIVPNMNAEIKFHSKMHDFKRFQKGVCFLKGSNKLNWEQTLKIFETEWGKLALEIPQETMEHIKYIKQILKEIATKDYKPVTWKNLSVNSPVDVEPSLTIWQLYVEELASKSWVEQVAMVPVVKDNAASESHPLFPSASGLQLMENLKPFSNNNEISVVKHITPKKIIIPDLSLVSLPGSSEDNEVHRLEINRDHNEVIQFTKEILNAKRHKKTEAGTASIFNTVYIVRHVNQQVSQKELINPFSDCNFKSKMIFHNFSKYDESDLNRLLAKLGDYPARSVCCLVFDLSVITTKLEVSTDCGSHSCNPVLFVNDLKIKSSFSSQALQELDHLIENLLNSITTFIQKLNKRISVLILPLVPTKVYCEGDNVIDHQTSHAISNLGTYVVHGSRLLWKRVIQTLIPSWNNIMEKNNGEYDFFNYIHMYTAIKPNTFLLLDNVSDFISKWTEPDIWKAFVEVLLLSLVPKKNSIIDSGITFMSEMALVSINITEISSTIPYGFLEELFTSVDNRVVIETGKEMYTVKNIILQRAVLLAKIINEYRIGDRILSATLHDITGPVNTEITKMQYLYITSVFESVYKSWKPWIITNLIKEIEEFDVTTLKTSICTKGSACPGIKWCVYYHSQLDKRRNPLKATYKMLLCSHQKQADGSCKDGDLCSFSRNIFEQNFHPFYYQVKLCPSRASSEMCNKRELCKYAHIDSPELLFTSDWKDLVLAGADNVLKFFAGAIRGSRKGLISNSFKIILVSPSAELLDMAITVCDELIKAFGLKVFVLGKNFDKPDDCEIIAGEPQAFLDLATDMLSAKNGVIIVDDTRSILGNQEKADALQSLIRRVRQASDSYLTKIGLVVTCSTEKSYKLAGGAKYFSNALGIKLHEQNSYTEINNISTSLSMEEAILQLQATTWSSSKRKDCSRSRSRSSEKKMCSTLEPTQPSTATEILISSDGSEDAMTTGSDQIQEMSRIKSGEKNLGSKHKSSSHSRRSHSKSRDRKQRAHSQSKDHKRRSRSRDHNVRSRSRDHKVSSRSSDHKVRPRSRDRKVRSRSRDRKLRSRSRDRKLRSRSRDRYVKSRSRDRKKSSPIHDKNNFKSSTQRIVSFRDATVESNDRIRPGSSVKLTTFSRDGLSYQSQSSLRPANLSKQLTGSYSSHTQLNWQGNKDIYHQKPEYWYQNQTSPSSNNITLPLELNVMEASLKDQLGAELYDEYMEVLECQTQLYEKEFLVFKNVPELCPSYERYYEAFSTMYARQHGYMGEEHKLQMWTMYWMSKLDEIKKEEVQSMQLKLLEEFKKKATSHSNNTMREEYKSNPGISSTNNSFYTIPETQDKNFQGQSTSSDQVIAVNSEDGEENNSFDFEKALTILEKLFNYIGFLGPALNAMVSKCKELGLTEEAYNVFTLNENVMVVNMVLDKIKTLKLSATGNLFKLYERAIEIIPKLLEEAKNGPKPIVNNPGEAVPIDVIAIARVSMGKSSDYTLNLLKTALQYEGISNPSREVINDLYLKVCKMQFELSQVD